MKKGNSASVGSAGKKVANGKNDMRVTTGTGMLATTGKKGRPSANKQDQRNTRA